MFLLPTVPIGILLGLLLGGRLGRLAYVRVSKPWLFYLALALQIAAFPSLFVPWQAGTQAGHRAVDRLVRLPGGGGVREPAPVRDADRRGRACC